MADDFDSVLSGVQADAEAKNAASSAPPEATTPAAAPADTTPPALKGVFDEVKSMAHPATDGTRSDADLDKEIDAYQKQQKAYTDFQKTNSSPALPPEDTLSGAAHGQGAQYEANARATADFIRDNASTRIAAAFGHSAFETAGSAAVDLLHPFSKAEYAAIDSMNNATIQQLNENNPLANIDMGFLNLVSVVPSAVIGAVGQLGEEIGSKTLASIPEAMSDPNLIGSLPAMLHAGVAPTDAAIRDFVTKPPLPLPVLEAVNNGIIEPSDPAIKAEAAQVTSAVAAAKYRAAQALVPEATPPTIEDLKKKASPDTYSTVAAASDRQDLLRRGIDNLKDEQRQAAEASVPHSEEALQAQRDKVENPESAMKGKKAQKKLDAMEAENVAHIEEATSEEHPEIAGLREGIESLDLQKRDLAEESSATRREAENTPFTQAEHNISDAEWSKLQEAGKVQTDENGKEFVRAKDYWDEKDNRAKAFEESQKPPAEEAAVEQKEPVAPSGKSPEEQHADIAADIAKKAQAAGIDKEQAETGAALQARGIYGFFGRMFGKSAEEMYAKYGAAFEKIDKEYANKKGTYNFITQTIKVMKGGDISTMMHEGAHHFLVLMDKFSRLPDAPKALLDEMKTIRDWLKLKEGDDLAEGRLNSKGKVALVHTRAHEQFARGFEQYLREGKAPSRELVPIFAKMKQWFSQIYEGVKNITYQGGKFKLTDEARAFFDRTLTENPEIQIEAKDHEPASAATHKAEAENVQPGKEEPVADNIESDIIKTAGRHNQEIANALKSTDETSQFPETTGGNPVDAAAPGPETGRENAAKGSGEVTEPSTGSAKEGGGERAVESATERGSAATDEKPIRSKPVADLFKAGNLVVSNIDASQEVEASLYMIAKNTSYLDHDVVSDLTVAELGRDAGVKNPDAVLDKLRSLSDKSGLPLASYVHAARQMLRAATREAIDFAVKVKGGTDEDFLNAMIAKDRFMLIATTLSKATNEIGRAMRAFQDLKGMGALELQELFQKTGATREDMEALFQTIASKDVDNLRGQIPALIQDSVSKPGFWAKAAEWTRCAILSNPITHGLWLAGTGVNIALFKPLVVDVLRGLENELGKRVLGREDTGSRVYGGVEGLAYTITKALPSILTKTGTALTERKTLWRPGDDFDSTLGVGARKTLGVDKVALRAAVQEAFDNSDQSALDALRDKLETAKEASAPEKVQKLQNRLDKATQDHINAITEKIATEMTSKMKTWAQMMEDLHHFGAAAVASFSTGVKDRLAPEFYEGKKLVAAKYSDEGALPDYTVKGLNVLPVGSIMRGSSNVIYSTMHTFAREFAANVEKTQTARRIAVRENNEAVRKGLPIRDVTERMAELFNNPTEEMLTKPTQSATRQTLMSNSTLRQDPHLVIAKELAKQEKIDAAKNPDAAKVDVGKRVQELMANPTDLMLAKVKALTAKNAQGGSSNLAQSLTRLRGAINNDTGTQIGNVAFPVISVPLEAAHQTIIDASPLGLISRTMRSRLSNEEGAEVGEAARAEMVAGTALLVIGAWQFMQGNVTPAESVNYNEEEQRKKEGKASNSVRIGNFMVSVTHTAKIGTLLTAGADLAHIWQVYRGEDISDKLKPAIQSAITNFFLHENPLTSGADMMDALRGKVGIENYLKNFIISRTVPQFIKATDDLMDPEVRESKSFMSALLAKLPGESESLAPKIESLTGEPLIKSPFRVHSANGDPIAQALSDIHIYPANPKPEINNVPLTPQQTAEYSSIKGHILHNGLQMLMQGDGKQDFDEADVNGKRKMVLRIETHASQCAKSAMFNRYPELLKDANDRYEASCAAEVQ